MLLQACVACKFGGEKEGKSHCGREAVFSYLTRCIQLKAMEYYLEHTVVEEELVAINNARSRSSKTRPILGG